MEVRRQGFDEEDDNKKIKGIEDPAQNSRTDRVWPAWSIVFASDRNQIRHWLLGVLDATKSHGAGAIFARSHQ